MRPHSARSKSISQLGDRLDLAKAPVELQQLVGVFNAMVGDCLTDSSTHGHQLHRLVQSFRTMLGTLDESFVRLSDFSSDIAHELRTPIHNLMIQSQVALSQMRSADEYRKVLESNVEELERLARLVGDILFLARADRAQAVLRKEHFDIREEVDKLTLYFEPLVEENGLRIECTGNGVVHADRMLIERVISNLLSNALRHSKAGRVVHAAIGRSGGMVRLEITNVGPGIPADLQKRVFDRFFQVDGSRSEHGDGSGLGLVIVKSITELHGGSVRVRSSIKGPTTFTASFPAHPTPQDVIR